MTSEAHGEKTETFIERFYPKINHLHLKENLIFEQRAFAAGSASAGTDNGNGETDERQRIQWLHCL